MRMNHLMKILLFLNACLHAQTGIREVEIPGPLRVDWMAPDGRGGVYLKSDNELFQVIPNGEMLPLRFPTIPDSISPATLDLFASPDGCLWGLDLPHLFRMAKPGVWEEIRVSGPYENESACRIWGPDSSHLEMRCNAPATLTAMSAGYSANVEWPRISVWMPFPHPVENSGSKPQIGQHPTWRDINKQTRKEMRLVLERNRPQNWRKSVWTFIGPDSGRGKDTIPFPAKWTGPGRMNGPGDFSILDPLMVKSGGHVWIALEKLIAIRTDSSWTLVFSSALNSADLAWKGRVPKSDAIPAPKGKKHTLLRAVPYFAVGYLTYRAVESGPGWASEAGWAYGGTMLGMVGGMLGIGVVTAPCWNGSCPEAALPYLVSLMATLPLMGAAWAVQSSDTRTDRQWQRFGSSMLGAATGIGVYLTYPDAHYSILLGLATVGTGAVVGYRFAWY